MRPTPAMRPSRTWTNDASTGSLATPSIRRPLMRRTFADPLLSPCAIDGSLRKFGEEGGGGLPADQTTEADEPFRRDDDEEGQRHHDRRDRCERGIGGALDVF